MCREVEWEGVQRNEVECGEVEYTEAEWSAVSYLVSEVALRDRKTRQK